MFSEIKILLFVYSFIGTTSCSQELTYLDFKNGDFYVPADEETKVIYKITRNKKKQIGVIKNFENTNKKTIA
jgi:hypothetical protein